LMGAKPLSHFLKLIDQMQMTWPLPPCFH
jgi:hypothetical protein